MRRRIARAGALSVLGLALTGAGPLAAQARQGAVVDPERVQAPTKLYHQPNVFDVLSLPGDFSTMRYSVGHLDRAARLQFRLEPQMRAYRRWLNLEIDITCFVLNEAHWQETRLEMPYGVPVRIGRTGMAAPAATTDASLLMWGGLGVTLPSAPSSTDTLRGTAQQASALVMADYVTQVLAAEVVVDRANLAGNKFWVRGLMTQLAVVTYYDRYDPESMRDLELFYRGMIDTRPAKMLAASDFNSEISLADWLWFQAHFFQGARLILDEEGRGVFRKMRKLAERNGDVLTGSALLDSYEDLARWYYGSFSAVSTRRAP